MKPLLLVTIVLFCLATAQAQNNQWTWVKGDSSINKFGVYGTLGSSTVTCKPGARNRSNNWTDAAGNFWMFGGTGCATTNSGYLNDLWQYNTTTNKWTWINGDNIPNMKSVYGFQGVPNITNKPGARKNSVTWVDGENNLWLFGGYGYTSNGQTGILNDLWKYDITANKWTWLKGDTISNVSGLYGSQGTSSMNKKPGARHLGHGWADKQGNLWLFGGYGYDVKGLAGDLNDLWRYRIDNNTWTWVKGDSLRNGKCRYGVKGTSSDGAKPGARASAVTWTTNGTFWLYGGFGYDALNAGFLGDLWKYNTATNQWTWVTGENIINVRPTYGTKSVPSILSNPGARDFGVGGTDAQGNLLMFGGFGYPANGFGYLNDLWKYNTTTNEWTWASGDINDNAIATYGSFGTPSPANKPGSRNQGICWTDEQGSFWMFGGQGYSATASGYLNDMWKYGLTNVLSVKLLAFTGKLENDVVKLDWKAASEQNLNRYEVEKSLNAKDFIKIGTVKAINLGNYSLIDKTGFNSLSGNGTAPNLLYYRLKVLDNDGKFTYSNVIQIKNLSTNSFTISPNPANMSCKLLLEKNITGKINVIIADAAGKSLQTKMYETHTSTIPLSVVGMSPGIYTILLTCDSGNCSKKLVIVP